MHIVTPSSDFYTGEIEYLCVDTPDGKVGIMHGAISRIAVLSAGCIEIKTPVLEQRAYCGDGLFFVNSDGVTILTEKCRFEGDEEDDAPESEYDAASAHAYKTAKAQLAATLKHMRELGDEK
ncbi:MAG: hypothetical protein J1G38_03510 [Clostridiales bacterium]|nr:hypothetical protein [Clostridiales bacterium]